MTFFYFCLISSIGLRRQILTQQQHYFSGQSPASLDNPNTPFSDHSSLGQPVAESSATLNVDLIANTSNRKTVRRSKAPTSKKKNPAGGPPDDPPDTETTAEGGSDANRFPAFCRYCGKKFSNLVKYRAHEAYHAKEPRFPCRFCGKPSHSKSNMLRHERTHTGEKPFKCRICDRSFTFKENATSHERIHTRGIKLCK